MNNQQHQYDALFYAYQREGALRSAKEVLPHLHRAVPIRSVLDVGCGAGAWLKVHQEFGVTEAIGIDGDYVQPTSLLIDPSLFEARNIAEHFDLGRRFDLVECLEVAEHVPAAYADQLIDNLVRHSRIVLFSAAVPGQGGEDHINEQPLSYWRDRFSARGYRAFDFIRPLVLGDSGVEPWYRYNTLVYVHDEVIARLPDELRATAIPDHEEILELAPLPARLQRAVLRHLPPPAVTRIAKLKHAIMVAKLRKQA